MSVSRIALSVAVAASLGVAVVGSAAAMAKEVELGVTQESKAVSFEVYLPLRNQAQLEQFLHDVTDASKPSVFHHWLTPAQFKAAYGPDAETIARAKAALATAGLR